MAFTNCGKGNFQISTSSSGTNAKTYHPKSLTISYDSLASENSGRSDDGMMHINWIRNKITKVEIEMPPLEAGHSELDIISQVQGQTYYIHYYDLSINGTDNKPGAYRTLHCYTSTSKFDCYSGVCHNGMWQGISFNAIEL